jgi:hypothetical protein
MHDLQQLVDQIRSIVQSSDQTRNWPLDSLASAYSEACTAVNQRLSQCQQLLQQGLRSEAIQLAGGEPKLLDVSASLAFPERLAWDELVAAYGLAPAPRLLVEAAQFLNEAYAQQEPLEDLLNSHRRLALARAPLAPRIGVLRKLAAQDPNNLIWDDDLRIFEKARFREIQAEATESLGARDATRVGKLLAELKEQTWVEQPPKALLQGLVKADAQFRGQQVRAALTDIESRLNDAFAARDPVAGRVARQNWDKVTASSGLDPNDPVRERVAGALHWLEEQDRRDRADRDHEASLDALARTLDEPGYVPPSDLERLAKDVLRYDRGMPERLQRQYVSRIESAEKTQARRFQMIAAGAAAIALSVGGLVFYSVRSQLRAGAAVEAAATVNSMLEFGEVEKASGYVKNLEKADSGLLAYPPLTEAIERYQAAQEKETDRVLQFAKAVRDSEQAPLSIAAPPSLETARSLARLETEKQEIARMLERRKAALEAANAKQEVIVSPRLDTVNTEMGQVGRLLEATPIDRPKLLEAIADAARTLSELTPNLELASAAVQRRAQALQHELKTAQGRLDALDRKTRLEEEITRAAAYPASDSKDNLAAFARRLEEYVTSFPEEPRSRAIKETQNEQRLWYTIDAWNQLAEEWKKTEGGLTRDNASVRAERCRQFLSSHPTFPDASNLAIYQKFAEATARRASGEECLVKKLEGLLSDLLVDHVWVVRISELDANGHQTKKEYYTKERPKEQADFVEFASIVSYEGKILHRTKVRDAVTFVGLSPQSKVAARFKPLLVDGLKVDQWEGLIIELYNAILREPEIDPILQVALLRKTLEAGIEGSHPFRESLEAMKARLDQAGIAVNVAWMDAEDRGVERARSEAAQFIQSLPDITQSGNEILNRRRQIERSVARIYRIAGWITRVNDHWKLQSGAGLPREAELLVIAPTRQSLGQWKNVGAIAEGKPRIDARDESLLREGRPVFIQASF